VFDTVERLASPAAAAVPERDGPSAAPAEPGFDRAEALRRVGGDAALLEELLGLFREQCPQWLAEIRGAIGENDSVKLRRAVHALNGAVGTFGAAAALDAALQLETMGREGNLTGAADALARLQRELHRLDAAAEEPPGVVQ
jgi:HPt (histidine-containing phosphotransfer) domain-containing protein